MIATAKRWLTRIGNAARLVLPSSYYSPLNSQIDGSVLAISAASQTQIPSVPKYGDQGYQVNGWAVCGSPADFVNPAYGNSDVVRIVGVNPGGAAQSNGLSVYMLNNAPATGGAAVGLHVIGVSNNAGPMWGYNAVLTDAPYQGTYTGSGRYLDNEFDFNISDPKTIMTGLSIGGTLITSPAYGAGIAVNFSGPGKITEAFYSWDGAANIGLHLGLFAKPQAPNAGSQAIQMDYADSNNSRKSLTLTAFANTMVLGPAGAAFGTADGAGVTQTITVGGYQLVISGGIIIDIKRGN